MTVPLRQARHHLSIYVFLVPCVLFIGTFMYYPVVNGIYHSVYTWNGGDVERPVGLQNFQRLFVEDPNFWGAFTNVFLLGFANILKMFPTIIVAVCVHRVKNERLRFIYRASFVVPMIVSQMVVLLMWRYFYEPSNGVLNVLLHKTGLMSVLEGASSMAAGIGKVFDGFGFFPWFGNLFIHGQDPAWLGAPKFMFAAVALWGFPWVGSIGVLMYLACLDNIGKEIYEAADVDGADWFHKFRYIEFPLILRQVRLMVVLVIMGTVNDASTIMILCNDKGGPGGVVDVPALFMFREAFGAQRMGSACGIGVVLFLVILMVTKLNEWLIKPED